MNKRGPKVDLTNQKFGSLTAIEYVGNSSWRCLCDCGKETISATGNLNDGKSKSCGACGLPQGRKNKGPKNNLVGKKFGKLTPIEYVIGGVWKCICECGNETVVSTRSLNCSHTISCGCELKEHNKAYAIDIFGETFGFLKVVERVGSDERGQALWRCLCENCGNQNYIATGQHLRSGACRSCGCVRSHGEKQIAKLLTEHGIFFQKEYTFSDLRSSKGGLLRFDFAIFKDSKLSHLIEYNGLQHYERAQGVFGQDFEAAQERDRLKIQYCKDHNIELRIIKYNQDFTIDDLI